MARSRTADRRRRKGLRTERHILSAEDHPRDLAIRHADRALAPRLAVRPRHIDQLHVPHLATARRHAFIAGLDPTGANQHRLHAGVAERLPVGSSPTEISTGLFAVSKCL